MEEMLARTHVPCEYCKYEFLLLDESPFPGENLDMYEQYILGIHGYEFPSRDEVAWEYGYSPNTAELIIEDVHRWLDTYSPYRNRRMRTDHVDPHPGMPKPI